MTSIAFLGLGAMGSRMATRLIEAGHALAVWNRAPERAAPLVERGAVARATPRDAAAGADVVISMVRDDAASQAVWEGPEDGALGGLSAGALAIECSTLSIGRARALATACAARQVRHLDAPVAGSRPQAEAGQLVFLVGGRRPAVHQGRPLLEAMGATVHHVGAAGAGTTVKLMVNGLFGAQLAQLAELIGLAQRAGIDPATAIEALVATPVASPAVRAAAGAMLAGRFEPAFPIELAAKDFDLVRRSAADVGAAVPIASRVGTLYRQAVDQGLGADNITGIAQLYR